MPILGMLPFTGFDLSVSFRADLPVVANMAVPRRPVPASRPRQNIGRPSRAISIALALGFVAPNYVKLPFDSPAITVMRGVLLVLFIPALLVFFRGLGSNARRLRASDLFMVLTCFWIILALTVVEGIGTAIVSGSLLALEVLGGYLIMRAYFTTRQDIEVFVKWFGRAVIALICIAVIDHIAGSNAVSGTLARIFGKTHGSEYRNGILRATSTLEHPILYGTMCALACIILFYGTRRSTYRLGYAAICTFGCALAMSSAPLLALILGVGVMIYDAVMRTYPWRWKLFLSGIGFCVFTLFLVRNDPIQTLIRNLTIDTQTGFYRLMIWNYAGSEALNSPWFGIGKGDWKRIPGMNGSVDTIWLVLALAYGLAVPILFGLGASDLVQALRTCHARALSRSLSDAHASGTDDHDLAGDLDRVHGPFLGRDVDVARHPRGASHHARRDAGPRSRDDPAEPKTAPGPSATCCPTPVGFFRNPATQRGSNRVVS